MPSLHNFIDSKDDNLWLRIKTLSIGGVYFSRCLLTYYFVSYESYEINADVLYTFISYDLYLRNKKPTCHHISDVFQGYIKRIVYFILSVSISLKIICLK